MTLLSRFSKMVNSTLRSMLVFYHGIISPVFGNQCRFHPTCSQYLLIAIERHGAMRGLLLGAWRLLRCNSLFEGGRDPVPGTNDEDDGSLHHSR